MFSGWWAIPLEKVNDREKDYVVVDSFYKTFQSHVCSRISLQIGHFSFLDSPLFKC